MKKLTPYAKYFLGITSDSLSPKTQEDVILDDLATIFVSGGPRGKSWEMARQELSVVLSECKKGRTINHIAGHKKLSTRRVSDMVQELKGAGLV